MGEFSWVGWGACNLSLAALEVCPDIDLQFGIWEWNPQPIFFYPEKARIINLNVL